MALLTLLFLSLSTEHVVFLCVLRVLAVFGLNARLIFSLIIIIIIILEIGVKTILLRQFVILDCNTF